MPTTYAHDVFGKTVYQKLPEEMRQVITNARMAYRIGLHGPDILFYYKPYKKNEVNQKGVEMHSMVASEFFERCKRHYIEQPNEILLSYMFGFICHYMLDSTCHPYITSYIEKTGVSHSEIETEMDRELMEKNSRNPFRYRPFESIRSDKETAKAIAEILGSVTEKQVKKCIKGMKFYTNLTVCSNPIKRKALLSLAHIAGKDDTLQGRIIRKKKSRRCEESNQMLLHLFKLAVPETVTVMEDFFESLNDTEYLNYRFERTYH